MTGLMAPGWHINPYTILLFSRGHRAFALYRNPSISADMMRRECVVACKT